MATSSTPKKRPAPRKTRPAPPHLEGVEEVDVQDMEVTSVGEWKKKSASSVIFLKLPSGFTIRAKNPGLRAFLGTGAIPNSLMGIITEALDERAKVDVSKIMKNGHVDMDLAGDMMKMIDSVTCQVFIEPKCWPVPVDGLNDDGSPEDRENLLYVDEVEDEDKQFLFGWVSGGTRDVETFRSEHSKSMDALSAGEGLGSTPKRPARNRAERRAR